ncbi:DmX-like protein 1 [Symbiodinium microadriaticum]|uniref:DmX-like protein 1 n=1 Tax=Symbiodinium microadriaticum TaxID=2951 RepID=A0A1Q9DER5_SYMMI|nr:DmX-like protein 1 [Symbiodinium microadriaticum]
MVGLTGRGAASGLYRQSKQMRVADFLANDLSEEPWRTKAEKNAFELVRQRRFELACAFFVFSQRARDAIDADGSA